MELEIQVATASGMASGNRSVTALATVSETPSAMGSGTVSGSRSETASAMPSVIQSGKESSGNRQETESATATTGNRSEMV